MCFRINAARRWKAEPKQLLLSPRASAPKVASAGVIVVPRAVTARREIERNVENAPHEEIVRNATARPEVIARREIERHVETVRRATARLELIAHREIAPHAQTVRKTTERHVRPVRRESERPAHHAQRSLSR